MARWNRKQIRSDDPQAVRKLTELIGELKQEHRTMKAANRLRRKGGENMERRLIAQGVPKVGIKKVAREGYDPQKLRIITTRIKQLEKRLADVKRARAASQTVREFCPGCYWFEDPKAMRIGFEFDNPPPERVCRYLASQGWKLTPSKGRWQRLFNSAGKKAGRAARAAIQAKMSESP